MRLIKIDNYWQATHKGPLREIVVEAPTMREAHEQVLGLVRMQHSQKYAQTGRMGLRAV